MACKKHLDRVDKTCLECFLARIAAISKALGKSEAPNLHDSIFQLVQHHKELPKNDLADSAIASLNYEIMSARQKKGSGWSKLELVSIGKTSGKAKADYVNAPLDPDAITAEHRAAYRRLIGRRGVWVGFAELHALGRLFGVSFSLYYPATESTLALGDPAGTAVNNLVLVFTGNHYEVARQNARAREDARIPINGLGDCGLESFLTMIATANLHSTEPTQRRLIHEFRQLLWDDQAPGPIPTSDEYWALIDGLRAYLATNMTNPEVDHAMVALGGRLLPKKDERGKVVDIEFDFSYEPSKLLKALPWSKSSFALFSKRVNQTDYRRLEISEVAGAFVLGGNFTVSGKTFWQDTLAFIAAMKKKGSKGVESGSPSLYLQSVDKVVLDFLDTEGRAHVNERDQLPTHIGACLINVITKAGTFAFLCAGLNMECGNGAKAKASTCYMGGGNGLHSEKYQIGLTQLILAGFGVPYDPLLSGHHFGTCTDAPSVSDHDVKAVELVFVNIACPCGTCQGFWANFSKSMARAGVEVTAYAYYFLDHANDWK